MTFQNILATSIIAAALLLAIASSVSLIGTAFAQEELGVTDTQTDTGTTATTTTTGGGGANQLAGIIASLQLAPDRLAPEWVTAGYWEMDSDMPLLGAGSEGTQQTVNRFDAIVEMTRIDDGTALHTHTFSDFRQLEVAHTAENTTAINGTMTVTLEQGPVQNVPVFITLQNNLITIAVDPVTTESHFGPTPITGIILAPEHLQQISNQLAPTAAAEGTGEGGGATGTETTTTTAGEGSAATSPMTSGTIGDATGP